MNVITEKCFAVGIKWLLGHPVHIYCVILRSTKRFVSYKFVGACKKEEEVIVKDFYSFWVIIIIIIIIIIKFIVPSRNVGCL